MTSTKKRESGQFPAAELVVPAYIDSYDGRTLVWQSYSDDGTPFRRVKPGRQTLADFLKLFDASDQQIAAFARKWGVLELCAHHLPASHAPWRYFVPLAGQQTGCTQRPASPDNGSKAPFAEYLGDWRQFARQAWGLCSIAAQLHRNTVGKHHYWRAVFDGIPDDSPVLIRGPWEGGTLEEEWRLVYKILDDWLSLGNVRPQVRRKSQDAHFALGGDGLFGALALQMLLEISKTDGIDWCAGCQQIILSGETGVRRDNRHHYCEECRGPSGREKAWRDAQRRRRDRQRRAREMHGEGKTIGAIVRALNEEYGTKITADHVREWIGQKGRVKA